MRAYLSILEDILAKGVMRPTRTGISALTIPSATFEHDMEDGFPLITTKRIFHKSMKVELEGFIKGVTDKKWFQDRGCKIWNEWCSPEKVPYGIDDETKARMASERDLGPIYGFQWRHSGTEYKGYDLEYTGKGIDQLANLISKIKKDPNDRRMIVDSWNPSQLHQMALPPCHLYYQATVLDGKLNLSWLQRSVDSALGLPFNIASYGTLLHLIARDTGLKEGKLTGHLIDTHIYENQLDGIKQQLSREPLSLPEIKTIGSNSIFDWDHTRTSYEGYKHHPAIEFPIAV